VVRETRKEGIVSGNTHENMKYESRNMKKELRSLSLPKGRAQLYSTM
jgi:hypothetical protein